MRATLARFGGLNPLRFLPNIKTNSAYERLPGYESRNGSPFSTTSLKKYKWRSPSPGTGRLPLLRMSLQRFLILAITTVLCLGLIVAGSVRRHRRHRRHKAAQDPPRELFAWEHFPRLDGYYSGVRNLVSISRYIPEQEYINPFVNSTATTQAIPTTIPLDPLPFQPYPDYGSQEYLQKHHPVQQCYLDEEEKIPAPDIYGYPGLPQNMTLPFFGSYSELGLSDSVCFERYGRFGPYGYGYALMEGGSGLGNKSEKLGSEKIWSMASKVDYRKVNWGMAQQRCYEKNKVRFEANATSSDGASLDTTKKRVTRQAYVLRTWEGFEYDQHTLLTLRAMVNELSLKSGGEYGVHFLVHIKNTSIPIWADPEVYQQTLQANVPEEFWDLSTLWSEELMRLYYPEPFPDNVANMAGRPVHSVYRSAHFALQWFAQQHPEYDFYWNWEMDMRYLGHYYEFHDRIGKWAAQQPRKGIWERSARFYIPEYHGSWSDFTQLVEEETVPEEDMPVWGPVAFENNGMLPHPNSTTPPTSYADDNYTWGVGEDADLITFNPLFQPNKTNWVFRDDVNGYSLDLPIPPRRAAIITVSRLSKRLLTLMHQETYKLRHTMFPEMWPPTVCLHHGLKAVYAPHPVYFDRRWPVDYMDKIFNHPQKPHESPFGWGEHNLLGSSFYYNSGFSGALWRRWLGYWENGEGGRRFEEEGSGRLCLRGMLFHPIKREEGPVGE